MRSPLIASALFAFASVFAGGACLPKPESVKEHRENFDRESIRGSLLLETPPPSMKRIDAEFGGRAKLLGYTVDPESPQPGNRMTIKLYWTAVAPMAEDY